MNLEDRRNQQRENQKKCSCDTCVVVEQRKEIQQKDIIIDALLGLLDKASVRHLDTLRHTSQLLKYGERGAEANYSTLLEKLAQAERERDFYKKLLEGNN